MLVGNLGSRIKSSEIFSRSKNDLGKPLSYFILLPRLQNKNTHLTAASFKSQQKSENMKVFLEVITVFSVSQIIVIQN